MARRSRSQEEDSDSVIEYNEESEASSGEDRIIEYDPDAVQEDPEVAQAAETADTIPLSSDLIAAQDQLESALGESEAFSSALAEEAADYQHDAERILGTGIGFRFVNGTLTSEITLKVFVTERAATGAQASAFSAVPESVNDVPVVVEEVGEVVPQLYTRKYPRPVRCGVSVGHPSITAGTLGCLVQLNNGRLCILSNNHVLANSNNARRGDPIIQPGSADLGQNPRDRIGALENFIPLQFPGPNRVDAAVTWTSFANVDPRHVTYQLNPAPVAPVLGMTVMKNGRTTQATIGTVTDLRVRISVGYPGGVADFRDQIGIRGIGGVFSRGGDSGSLIVTANSKQPVGLLFAGRRDNSVTFANPIGAVVTSLGIRRFIHRR